MNVLSKLELDYSILVSCLVISIYYFYQKLETVPNWVSHFRGQIRPKQVKISQSKSKDFLVKSAKISGLENCWNIHTFNTFNM